MKNYYSYINGKAISTNNLLKIKDISNDEIIGQVSLLNKEMIDLAVTSANNAFENFQKTTFNKRKKILLTWAKLINKNRKQLINFLMQSIAKSSSECEREINTAINFIKEIINFYYFQQPPLYDCIKSDLKKYAFYLRKPRGVILCINPFNYPISSCMFKVVPALLTGNTVVFKSSTQCSIALSYLFKLFNKIKCQKGIVNYVITMGSQNGDYLIKNSKIKMINFTGSSKIGNQIKKISCGKKLLLELGGNDIAIVLNDCDLNLTIKELIKGSFLFNGQRCTGIKRLVVEKTIFPNLIKKLIAAIKELKIGDPRNDSYVTSLISMNSVNNAKKLIKNAIENGAELIIGNKFKNRICYPTILTNVDYNLPIFQEEQFAPILPICVVEDNDYEKIVAISNSSEYGLQSSIFTTNIKKAIEFAKQIDTGTFNINGASSKGPDYLPFFGIKESGIGSQGYSDVLLACTLPKGIIINYN